MMVKNFLLRLIIFGESVAFSSITSLIIYVYYYFLVNLFMFIRRSNANYFLYWKFFF
jgi:hypothetical protein